jgi:predicted outer membrane repeat protein
VGNEPANYDLNKRNLALNETILSGDIGNQSLATDNSHHVVTTTGVSDQTIIDGFTIRDGNGAGGSFSGNGGGWLNNGSNAVSNPVLKNIKFIANKGVSGAAMYNNGLNGEASPAVINCVFAQNVVTGNGGAVYNQASSGKAAAKFINCTFYNNQAGGEGGAIYNYFNQATPKADLYIYNSILWENKSNTSTTTTINNDFF